MRLLLLSCCLSVFFAGCTKEETPVVKKIRARFKNGLDVDIRDFRFQSTPDLAVLKIDSLKKGAYTDYVENPEIHQNYTATGPVHYYYRLTIPYANTYGTYSGTGSSSSAIPTQKLFPGDYTIAVVYTGTGTNKGIKFEFEK